MSQANGVVNSYGNRKLPRVILQFVPEGDEDNFGEFEFTSDDLNLGNRLIKFEYIGLDASISN